MKTVIPLIVTICALTASSVQAQARLSFTGGWFDETVHDTAYVYLPALHGEEFQGSPWHFNVWSILHERWGWNPDLEDTGPYYLCPDPPPDGNLDCRLPGIIVVVDHCASDFTTTRTQAIPHVLVNG